MTDSRSVLPYRVDAADLSRYLTARARGRDNSQVQAALDVSVKSLEGILSAAVALGFAESSSGALTNEGRQFALASSDDARKELIAAGMLRFEPYELLLEAVLQRGESVTTLDWIETWWNTHGFGSSASNRTEGSSAFGRLAGFAGLGSYIQGRRGHSSRIEWANGALRSVLSDSKQPAEPPTDVIQTPEAKPEAHEARSTRPAVEAPKLDSDKISLNLPLGPGRVVEIRLPSRVGAAEKQRLIQLLQVLIPESIDDGADDEA